MKYPGAWGWGGQAIRVHIRLHGSWRRELSLLKIGTEDRLSRPKYPAVAELDRHEVAQLETGSKCRVERVSLSCLVDKEEWHDRKSKAKCPGLQPPTACCTERHVAVEACFRDRSCQARSSRSCICTGCCRPSHWPSLAFTVLHCRPGADTISACGGGVHVECPSTAQLDTRMIRLGLRGSGELCTTNNRDEQAGPY